MKEVDHFRTKINCAFVKMSLLKLCKNLDMSLSTSSILNLMILQRIN